MHQYDTMLRMFGSHFEVPALIPFFGQKVRREP